MKTPLASAPRNAIEERILEIGPDNVAAFIGEPVQGAGGVIIPPRNYWKRVEAILPQVRHPAGVRRSNLRLRASRPMVRLPALRHQAGHGLDGEGLVVRLSADLRRRACPHKIVDVLREKGGDFVHGFTYSGHPTSAAVALKNIEIIEREGLIERARDDAGPYLAKALARLDDNPLVGEARSLGLIGAVEIVAKKGTNERFLGKEGKAGPIVRDLCINNGLMVRAIRDTIVMRPPLIITHDEIDRMVDIIDRALREAEPTLRALPPSDD